MSGIDLKNKDFLEGLRIYEDERKIDSEFIYEALKEAIVKTYRNHIDAPEASVRVDVVKNVMHVYHELEVVEDGLDAYDETLEIALSQARKINPDVNIGDKIEQEVDFREFGRSSINVTKQLFKQKIKEHEKQRVYDEYKNREFDLISGIVKTVEDKFILVDIKNTIGILLKSEQIPGEKYREGQTIRTIIKKVSKDTKGSQVVLSRADETFVKRLFEKEVPEIAQGIIEIKAIARDAGDRTKMAVYSKNEDVDAIGACIGPRGTRVQAVIGEVKGEKIDVFEWNDDIGELVKNALAPAEVKACFYADSRTDESLTPEEIEKYEKYNNRPLVVIVDDEKLSVAIGKNGKNAKLAVKLTNRKIDIKTESEIAQLDIDVPAEEAYFKEDQARILKEKEAKRFQELQEEAAKRRAEFEEELAQNDTGFLEEAFDEFENEPEEITIDDMQEEKEEVVEEVETKEDEVVEEKEAEELVEEEKQEEEIKEVKEKKKAPLTPKTDYVSKFEEYADSSKKEEQQATKKRRKSGEDDRRLRAENLEKKEYGEIKPEYTEEELEEIRLQEEEEDENSWINDDDIDFDEYDEYYDEDN